MQFRAERAEYNEKLAKNNHEYYAEVMARMEANDNKITNLKAEIQILTGEKNDAEELVDKKRLKLKIAEERIKALEEELSEKTTECKNRIRAYDRMKRENDECKKKTGMSIFQFLNFPTVF